MDTPRIIINSEETFLLEDDLVTIGRASENDVCLSGDKNISRYHAEIEYKDSEYWIIDLGSFNGTELNGERIDKEKPLFDGDIILLGGSANIEFLLSPSEEEEPEPKKKENSEQDAPAPPQKKSLKLPIMLVVAALAVGLAIIFVFAAGYFYFTKPIETACNATAKITNFEDGDIISESTDLEVELENGNCASKAYFMMDGEEIAKAESQPFTATIDPSQLAQFSDGQTHQIQIVLEDEKGNKIPQSSGVSVVLRTIETKTPTPVPQQTGTDPQTNPPPQQNQRVSLIDVNNMSKKVVPQFSGSFKYKTNNQFFLQEVQKKTAEYAVEGYYERAEKYRDHIDTQFIQERNLDPPLGYILAMSRSKFLPSNDSKGAGLWRMSNDLVVANAYNGLCGTETIAAPSQKCAAIASSEYLKDLILRVFEGDVIYGIAAFGMSPEEAAAWKDSLPADRSDFWNVIKSPQQREEVVRFFAAAMVAENPQKFGLKNDRPLSELYKIYMQ